MKKTLLILGVLALTLGSCTENQRAKSLGGNFTEDLPCGEKLIEVTWKNEQMWILTRPMRANETAETYSFQEKSNWGMMEGTVTLKECK